MCSKTHKTRFIFILQKCSIICTHGSDYCYPSTSLDQDLELGGGLGQRSHRVEKCSSRFVPLLLEPGTAESRMGRWNCSRQRGFLTVLPPTRVPAALPRTVIHALRWSQGCLQVSACWDTRYNLNNKTHSFLCKTSWIVKTNPQVQYKPIGKTGNIK